MAYSVQLVAGTEDETLSGTESESFVVKIKLPAAASDTSVALGTITDSKAIVVYGGEGVSFKLDAAGTDPIAANPFACLCDEDGMATVALLFSNSSASEKAVSILVYE